MVDGHHDQRRLHGRDGALAVVLDLGVHEQVLAGDASPRLQRQARRDLAEGAGPPQPLLLRQAQRLLRPGRKRGAAQHQEGLAGDGGVDGLDAGHRRLHGVGDVAELADVGGGQVLREAVLEGELVVARRQAAGLRLLGVHHHLGGVHVALLRLVDGVVVLVLPADVALAHHADGDGADGRGARHLDAHVAADQLARLVLVLLVDVVLQHHRQLLHRRHADDARCCKGAALGWGEERGCGLLWW